MSVLIGRLAEGMGRNEDALRPIGGDSWDRRAAAQGELRKTLLRYSLGDLKRDDVISQLEKLTTIWRGDDTEIEALQMLAQLYTDEGHYRDSFYAMRSALAARPNSDMTRRIQQEAAKIRGLFLSGKGDALPAIDALALFYDFRELTPIGRRGDEMIRRLAIGWWRSICSIRPPICCNTRWIIACRALRGRRSRRGWRSFTCSIARPTGHWRRCGRRTRRTFPKNCAISACSLKHEPCRTWGGTI